MPNNSKHSSAFRQRDGKRRFLEDSKGGRECSSTPQVPACESEEGAAGKTARKGKRKWKGLLSCFIRRTRTTQAGWSLIPPGQVTTDAALCKRLQSACYSFVLPMSIRDSRST